ncbi:MAG: alanine--tRNA ligase [Candidatus Bipolaricaulota bacterium]|nr:alanine--tRNA ligase [Candidatus Bipolaricaulota bacterium]MCS7274651.1 alanine--tRNA ligase [Candidatus Bipolaricaulota bacterium]MDW8110918.1 alanine--tRNA ligase [Candidatus Bipolaricaulota bacterium]MDW8329121.1 alanine--tRNA ligase [Candidatus Bipolaricaulota bacterium]
MTKRWTASHVRQTFLEYFRAKGHTVEPSSSLVPDDPTLLFTNSGMVQFKKLFLGVEKRSYTRAATAQKCMRVSGKHNDLENVGPSPRHHTFFEMLGNFSFGDYFKRDAIFYAWELLTEIYGLDRDRFHFTIYKDDEESFQLWQEIAQAPKERIHRMGEKTNFWMMGETGPCGPNTELIWDRGKEFCDCGRPDCSPALDNDCNRWFEVWNLVFMQFNQEPDGRRTPLPKPGVDTGMGLERIVAVLQNAPSNYDTDLFYPIFEGLRELTKHSPEQMRQHYVPYRVIADHGRAMTFLMADGVLPSNEKQGYVLRMVMRRAIRFGKRLGLPMPFLPQVARLVIETMGEHYTELKAQRDFILKAVAHEEERFERTLDQGLERAERIISELKRKGEKLIYGPEAFFLHDTYGFPVEMLEDIAREHGMHVDRAGFEREMEKQRARSRGAEPRPIGSAPSARHTLPATRFVGYQTLEHPSELLFAEEQVLVFPETPFYAEAGGQVADTGRIENLSRPGKAEVVDVQKDERGVYLHRVRVTEGEFRVGDRCLLKVDAECRARTMRNHTATHLLHAALRRVLGYSQGIQAGSLVAPDELRFDFKHLAALTPEEIARIEELANRAILADLPVTVAEEPLESAKARGAMALFAEDYAGKEKVRVVTVAPLPGDDQPFSVELCGGTHVQRTGQIGLLKIISEGSVAAGVRRVHVAVGENLLAYLRERERVESKLSQLLKTSERELVPKLEALLAERDALWQEREALRRHWLASHKDRLVQQRYKINEASVICARLDLSVEDLKTLSDLIEPEITPGVVLLGGVFNGKASLVCKVSEALTKHLHAGQMMKALTPLIGGGGGGTPRFAQGGGSNPTGLDEALRHGEALIRARL